LSYGDFALQYDRILVPRRFHRPGRDLLARVSGEGIGRLLDIGTGTGTILDHCTHRFDLAVGVDPSLEMLRVASSKGHARLAAASLPSLPFVSNAFDAATAGFVLSHVPAIPEALAEIRRVVHPGGSAAVSSWASVDNLYRTIWTETLEEFIDADQVLEETSRLVPFEEELEQPGALGQALDQAGFRAVESWTVAYAILESTSDFVEARSLLLSSQIIRARLGTQQWRRLLDRAIERLTGASDGMLSYIVEVHMARGNAN